MTQSWEVGGKLGTLVEGPGDGTGCWNSVGLKLNYE